MKRTIHLIFGIFILSNLTFAQDTTYLDKKVEFSSDTITIEMLRTLKTYHKFARELIKVSKDSFKIEYCNYLDGKRVKSFFLDGYKFESDSALIINNDKWAFRKICENNFSVKHTNSNYVQKGTAYSIIPFIKNGDFVYMNTNNDTLLTEYFKMSRLTHVQIKKTIINDSVYSIVDKNPKFPNQYGVLADYISQRLKFPIEYAESSIQGRVILKTVITKTGELKNIEVMRGIDLLLDTEAVKVIMTLPKFEPGKINGINVNTYFIIPVKFALY